MTFDELDMFAKDISSDIDGLKRILERIKKRNINMSNAHKDFQAKDIESASTLAKEIAESINKIEEYLFGREE